MSPRLAESASAKQPHAPKSGHEDVVMEIGRVSISQWEHCVANDHARIHNGHVYIQNQYSGHGEESSQGARATTNRVDFMEALKFDHMDSRYESIDPGHLDTCRWLFQKPEYLRWRDERCLDSHSGFLWIKGKAGSGKSTLMKCALKHAQTTFRDDRIISFFFNARGQRFERLVEGMYRSLILQMIRHFPQLREHYPAYSPDSIKERGWNIAALRKYLDTANLNLDPVQAVTIYVDALDECNEDDIRAAIGHLEVLGSLSVSRRVPIRICFASRHYPRITIHRCEELILDDQDEHQRDIRRYIGHSLPLRDVNLKLRLAAQIEARSSGIFLWVVVVVRLIRKKFDGGASYTQLIRTLQEVPDELQALIGAIVHSPDGAFLCAMRWMLFARMKLTVPSLYFAIQISTGRIGSGRYEPTELSYEAMVALILASSRGLIEKTPDHSVQLIHESVREYFLAGGLAALGTCSQAIVEAGIHAEIFKCCHAYLGLVSKDIFPIQWPRVFYVWNPLERYPLLWYAAMQVLPHFGLSLPAQSKCLCSLQDFYLEPLLDLVSKFHGIDNSHIQQHLSEPRYRYSALLFLAITSCNVELIEAMLAEDTASPEFHSDATSHSARPHDCKLTLGQRDVNIRLASRPRSFLALALDERPDEPEIAELLIDHGADVDVDEGLPLRLAVERCDSQAVKLLLNRGANTEIECDIHENTVLTEAVQHLYPGMVKLLLNHGADANGSHKSSNLSPLLAALQNLHSFDWPGNAFGGIISSTTGDSGSSSVPGDPHVKIICALLDHNADIHLKAGTRSISPLEYAIERFGRDVFQLLLTRGHSTKHQYRESFVCAARKLNVEVVEHCLQAGLGVEAKEQALDAALLAEDNEVSRWTVEIKNMNLVSACLRIVHLLRNADAAAYENCAKFRAQGLDAALRWKTWTLSFFDDQTKFSRQEALTGHSDSAGTR